jgi:hypothetical protein
VNAAHAERRFLFVRPASKKFRKIFSHSTRSVLGLHNGKKDAIRFYRAVERRRRKMLRRVIDLRSAASPRGIESHGLSIDSRSEEGASRADVDSESFALTNDSV